MKLKICNVGPFRGEQEILLDGITVLAGLNGSGKSTFGKALFCAFSAFFDVEEKVKKEKLNTLRLLLWRKSEENRNRINMGKINNVLRSYKEKLLAEKEIDERVLDELIYRIVGEDIGDEEKEELKNRIKTVLSVDDSLVREKILSNWIEAEFGNQIRNVNENEKAARVELKIKNQIIAFESNSDSINIHNYISLIKNIVYFDDPNVANDLDSYVHSIYDEDSHGAVLLSKLQNEKNNVFSSIDQIIIQDKIKTIEEKLSNVCEGNITEIESNQYRYFSREYKEGLNIGNMATGLKSFAILKKLLKEGYLEENGTIIFDEPEIHLHPEWQRYWAEIIVLLYKELGMHILLSTHSSDFLGFLELYIHKYQASNKTRVYMLEKKEGNTSVKDVSSEWDYVYRQLGKPFIQAAEELDRLNGSE